MGMPAGMPVLAICSLSLASCSSSIDAICSAAILAMPGFALKASVACFIMSASIPGMPLAATLGASGTTASTLVSSAWPALSSAARTSTRQPSTDWSPGLISAARRRSAAAFCSSPLPWYARPRR